MSQSLQEQIDQLKTQVNKQRKVLAETAEQLLSLQIKQSRDKLAAIPNPDPKSVLAASRNGGASAASATSAASTATIDTTDFATNEDLVQLVGELQGQLGLLEQRSVNRVANSTLTEDSDKIHSMPNADGVPAPDAQYPHTVTQFKALKENPEKLIQLCKYYELLPDTLEDEARMKAFMDGRIESPNVPADQFKPKAEDYSKETLDGLFEDLRVFVGLRKM